MILSHGKRSEAISKILEILPKMHFTGRQMWGGAVNPIGYRARNLQRRDSQSRRAFRNSPRGGRMILDEIRENHFCMKIFESWSEVLMKIEVVPKCNEIQISIGSQILKALTLF